MRDDLRLLPGWPWSRCSCARPAPGDRCWSTALRTARAHAAVGALPFVLNLIARDQATTDRWAIAEATYREAIDLARESGQQAELAFGLAGLAWLQARRGREQECRRCAAEALGLSADSGWGCMRSGPPPPSASWNSASVMRRRRLAHFEQQQQLLADLAITDPDLSPGRRSRRRPTCGWAATPTAQRVAGAFTAAAQAKGQPWSLARALRCQGLLAARRRLRRHFEQALALHEQTPDEFEAARTRLAYGERLRRARNRVLAREQLRAAAEMFERLDARPWADRARAELAATGETRQRGTLARSTS